MFILMWIMVLGSEKSLFRQSKVLRWRKYICILYVGISLLTLSNETVGRMLMRFASFPFSIFFKHVHTHTCVHSECLQDALLRRNLSFSQLAICEIPTSMELGKRNISI